MSEPSTNDALRRLTLHDVGRRRVAVDERRLLAMACVREEARVQVGRATVGELDAQRALVGVDRDDAAAVAVLDAEPLVVALDHDDVADGELAAGEFQSFRAELAGAVDHDAGTGVQLGHLAAASRDHDRASRRWRAPRRSRPPCGRAARRALLGEDHVAVLARDGERVAAGARAQQVDLAPVVLVALAAVLGERRSTPGCAASARKHPPASISGSWCGSPTRTTFVRAARPRAEDLVEVERAEHPGLVDDEHAVRGERRSPTAAQLAAAAPPRSSTRCRPGRRAHAPPRARPRRRGPSTPDASQAARAASSANVLPLPAGPTTTCNAVAARRRGAAPSCA